MLSSKNESKQDARFAAKLDVLTERVDSLASTLSTTASAMAKKDGEIAALRRDLEARDQTLQALVAHARQPRDVVAADVPVDAAELRALRNAVAALTKERASGVNAARIEGLVATVRTLAERVDALAAAAAAPSEPIPDPAVNARVDAVEGQLAIVKTTLERPHAELVEALATLGKRVDGLAEREPGVTEEQLNHHVAAASDALAAVRKRLDTLTETLDGHEQARALDKSQRDRRFEEMTDGLGRVANRLDEVALRSESLDALDTRLSELERARSADDKRLERRFTDTGEALGEVSHRLEAIAGELERMGTVDEGTLDRRFAETRDALATLTQRVDAFHSIDEIALDRRFEDQDNSFTRLARRLDTLAETVESASSNLRDKEVELASLQRHFTASSSRIESIVDDIRDALHAFPEVSSSSIDDLVARVERFEAAARKTNETGLRAADELTERIDLIDQRLATVADEVSRAKTLWPVALRSLEARLEDVAHARKPEPHGPTGSAGEPADEPDDLLAGLRDSLQAMESVAAEMVKASETLTGSERDAEERPPADEPPADEPPAEEVPSTPRLHEPLDSPAAAAAAGAATVVPLRATDP
jgi:chromosome segregation ATPase